MKNAIKFFAACSLFSLLFSSCDKDETVDRTQPIIVAASGDITAEVDQFRNILGATLNTTPGHVNGRREINWDGVPDNFENESLPVNFFNPTEPGSSPALQRGFSYIPIADARVSGSAFASLEPSNAIEFSSFSGGKTFSAVGTNLWNVEFQVPGQAIAAKVKGFGAVFSDVDVAASTSMEYFSGNRSLGVFQVPVRTTGSHSFLGVYFPNEQVTAVKIRQGNAVIAPNVKDISAGGTVDLVVMDDFLYDEPQAL